MFKFKLKKNKGFVILYAVTLAAILLGIALGVVNIALKEVKFGTSAKDTNNAFFAADAGVECALVNDKSTTSLFTTGNATLACNGVSVTATESPSSFWTFVLNMNSTAQGCAKVTVDKTISAKTTIIAKGKNISDALCSTTSASTVERELKTSYSRAVAAPSLAYGGTPWSIPGTIQAEDYDTGGAGVSYFDTTLGNTGAAYRADDVDIQATTDTGGGYNVGWTIASEWLNYSVNVTTAGTYTLGVRVASAYPGGTFHIEANGVNVTGPMTIPNTGDWQTWTTLSKTISLSAGLQIIKIVEDTNGASAFGNFNYLSFNTLAVLPPPTFRSYDSAGITSGNLTINKPTGTVQNDVMIASIAVRPYTATISQPAGWTLINRVDNLGASGGQPNSLATYYRVAGASEGASYLFTIISTASVGGILSFSGVNTTTSIYAQGGQNSPVGFGLDSTAPSINTIDNTMIVTAHAFASSSTWTPPSGMTEAFDKTSTGGSSSAGESIEMNYVVQGSAGATGTKTATAFDGGAFSDAGNAQILSLQP